jgi:hypothetical protein
LFEKNDIAETLHLEFCKYIMKVKKCTPNYIVYGELGRVPMSVHINARMIELVKTIFLLFLICERQLALYGIKCVRRIFLTNMAAHTHE